MACRKKCISKTIYNVLSDEIKVNQFETFFTNLGNNFLPLTVGRASGLHPDEGYTAFRIPVQTDPFCLSLVVYLTRARFFVYNHESLYTDRRIDAKGITSQYHRLSIL
jgi:hypothetical protein